MRMEPLALRTNGDLAEWIWRKQKMYLDDVEIGLQVDIPPVVIDRERMMDFARLYDPIPLHCDEEYAKKTKFGRLIAPGVMSFMAVWAKLVEQDIFGDELIAGKSTKIEWMKPVFADDVLKGEMRVSKITRRNAYNGIAELFIEVRNQHGELVLTDVTECIVKYRT